MTWTEIFWWRVAITLYYYMPPLEIVMNEYFLSTDAIFLKKKNKQKKQKSNNPNQTNQPTKYLQQKTQFCVVKSMAGVSLDGPWTANLHAITPDGSLTLQSNGWRLGDILESCKGLDYEISLNIFPFQLLPVSFAHSSLKTEETSISLPQIPYKCFKKFLLFAQCKDHNAP